MKKFFIIGMAAMGLALTACNNDETVEVAKGNAISFNSFVNKSTRGAADDVTLKNLGSFELYGWRGNDVLFNKQVVNVAENGTSTYSPEKYWEAGKTYNFEAIAPKAGEKGVEFVAAKTAVLSHSRTMPQLTSSMLRQRKKQSVQKSLLLLLQLSLTSLTSLLA